MRLENYSGTNDHTNIKFIILDFDDELNELATRAAQAIGVDGLIQVIEHQRCNHPMVITEEDGFSWTDEHFSLKQVLAELPEYWCQAQLIGLNLDQALEIMMELMENDSDLLISNHALPISLLTQAFNELAQQNEKIDEDGFLQINRMVQLTAQYGDVAVINSLASLKTGIRIGLSVQEVTKIISDLPEKDGAYCQEVFPPFLQALKALIVTNVLPETVVKVFDALGGKSPYKRKSLYQAFEQAIIFGCPANNWSVKDTLECMSDQIEKGEAIEDILEDVISGINIVQNRDVQIIFFPNERIENYFAFKEGPLELIGLPYRTKMTFHEGVVDLGKLAKADGLRWEDEGEGFWVYDPDSDWWYSLGGLDEEIAGGIRHRMIAYDISELSSSPKMFHIHPEGFEVYTRPRDKLLFPPEYTDQVSKFITVTPSRADFNAVSDFFYLASKPMLPRSFIQHALGITEFTYPNDPDLIRKLAQDFKAIKDQAIGDYPWKSLRGYGYSDVNMVLILIDHLNALLSNGFSINLYRNNSSIPKDNL